MSDSSDSPGVIRGIEILSAPLAFGLAGLLVPSGWKETKDAMEHRSRISIKDTPAILERMLFSLAFDRAKEKFPPGTSDAIIKISLKNQPEERLEDIFWISDEMTDIIFEAAQDKSLPARAPGESRLDLTRRTGVMFEAGTGLFTIDPTAPKSLWRSTSAGALPPVCEVLGFIIHEDAKILVIYGLPQRAADNSPAQAPRGPGEVRGIPESPGEVPRVAIGGRYAMPDSDMSEAVIRLVDTTFFLMGDESLAEVEFETVGRKAQPKRSKRRGGQAPFTVRTVRVGRQLQKEAITIEHDSEAGREGREEWYSHQFVVRGHWRNVAYGKGLSKRRLRWIMPFLKGPEGTPVIRRPLVRVWR